MSSLTISQWIRADHGPVFNRLKPLTFLLALPVVVPIGAFRTLSDAYFFKDVGDILGGMFAAIWTGNNGGWD